MKFKITIKDNETNEVLIEQDTNVVVGGYNVDDSTTAGMGVSHASDDEIIDTCGAAIRSVKRMLKDNCKEFGNIVFMTLFEMVMKGDSADNQETIKAD